VLSCAAALGTLPSRTASAESRAPRVVTLDEAIGYARAHHPAIRVALARVRAEQTQADIPRAQWSPVFGATAQIFAATANNTTGTSVTPGFMDLPRIGGTRVTRDFALRPYASTLVAIGGTQELYDFGRIAAQTAAADAEVDIERQRARAGALDVSFDVAEAYFAVFAARGIVKASEEAYERARAHRDFAKAGVDAGLRPPIELTRAEADLGKFDIGRVRATGGLTIAQTTLAAAVGAPDAELGVAEAPPRPAEMPNVDVAIAHAAARDPRMLAIVAELRAEEARTRAIGAETRPDLAVTASLSGRAGGAPPSGNGSPAEANGFLPYVPNWDVGMVLSWPLFDETVSARRKASLAEEDVRKEQIAGTREQLAGAIRQAYVAVDVARSTLPRLEHAVDASRANYAQAEARFRAGLGTSIELADAEAIRADSEIHLALGAFELARARAAFGRTMAEGL
jgi:outer membrane protein TolC